ncbi:MAG TPA: 30S ribosomal protein S5 [Planctomycetia bacterium]|nr:30S ribosomal protein S5 [Planctomycetia bacterium]
MGKDQRGRGGPRGGGPAQPTGAVTVGGGPGEGGGAHGGGGGGGPRRGGPGGGRGRRDRDSDGFESVIQIKRCAAVVKGGRRFSFNAVVVVGDKKGRVGLGYGKAVEVPPAVDKAVKQANRSMVKVPMNGGTVTHMITGHFGASRVLIMPASPGTGVIAGRGVRDVMVAAGITDVLTKCLGSTNPINVIKAALEGLGRLRTRDEIAILRGVKM